MWSEEANFGGHVQCYDKANIFNGQQVEPGFAVPIFFQIFQGSDYSRKSRLKRIQGICLTRLSYLTE